MTQPLTQSPPDRATANAYAVSRLTASEPVLEDVADAGSVVPGMTPRTILTSGAPLPWREYRGGQRRAIIGAALFEGLARDERDADEQLGKGKILLQPCHDHATVGSLTGVCTWSMPVLVVRDEANGTRAYCRINEGGSRQSLTFGVWNAGVRDRLVHLRDVVTPVLSNVLRGIGGLPLAPLIRRALTMGDDLHSRHKAAGSLFRTTVLETLLDLAAPGITPEQRALAAYLREAEYFFLHVVMAAAKAATDAAAAVPGSSLVTAMNLSEKEFAIRVSGLGTQWFTAPLPPVTELQGRLFDGARTEDLAYVGGESLITEALGLGGMAAAAAMPLQDASAGTPPKMIETTERMYGITLAEHPAYRIPALGFRGVPCGIDAVEVARTGIVPAIHLGLTLREGGHAGAALFHPPIRPFHEAAAQLATRTHP